MENAYQLGTTIKRRNCSCLVQHYNPIAHKGIWWFDGYPYHQSRGDHHRNIALIHLQHTGTNPASASMAGGK
jgi:hypothetical protein